MIDPDFGEFLAYIAGEGQDIDVPVPRKREGIATREEEEESNFPADDTY